MNGTEIPAQSDAQTLHFIVDPITVSFAEAFAETNNIHEPTDFAIWQDERRTA